MGPISSVSQMMDCDTYRELRALGPEIVPFIISDFYHDDFHHLTQLIVEFSGEDDIVPERDWGKINRIANWYVWWGRNKGLLNLTYEETIAYNVGTDAGKALIEDAILGPIKYIVENGEDEEMITMYTAVSRKSDKDIREQIESYKQSLQDKTTNDE